MKTHDKIIIILCLIAFISLAFLPPDNPQLETEQTTRQIKKDTIYR